MSMQMKRENVDVVQNQQTFFFKVIQFVVYFGINATRVQIQTNGMVVSLDG